MSYSRRTVLAAVGSAAFTGCIGGIGSGVGTEKPGRNRSSGPGTDTSAQLQPTPEPERSRPQPSVLKGSPFVPQNADLLDPAYYERGKPFGEPGPVQTTDDVRQQLRETLRRRFEGDRQRVSEAMQAFDDPDLTAKVPDVSLRGAVVALQSASGEAAFDAIANDSKITNVSFSNVAEMLDNDRALATTRIFPPDDTVIIQIDERLRGEDIRALAPTLMHESLHTDANVSPKEELIANTVESLTYGEFVAEDPSLAKQDTELVRRANTELLARLNSRDRSGRLRLLESQGPILPESTRTDLRPFADLKIYSNPGDDYKNWQEVPDTGGNEQLNGVLSAQTGAQVQARDFDDRAIALLDRNQAVLDEHSQKRLIETLELLPANEG